MTIAEALPKVPHRPYSRIRGKRERSVTEIIGLKAIPGLPYAAANETALMAVYSEDWRDLDRDAAYETLRKHHRGVWDSRAAIGTACHSVMECWYAGEEVDLYEVVCHLAETDRTAKSWFDHEDEAVERLTGYVDGLEKWWSDWSPSGGSSEDCVRTPGVYIGQRDRWGVSMAGQTWGLDLKCTAQQDDDKGVYGDSWALQLAAYRFASEVVEYGFDDKGKLGELSTRPNDPVDRAGIIHLRGDGGYTLFDVRADESVHEAFLTLAKFNTWLRDVDEPRPMKLVTA